MDESSTEQQAIGIRLAEVLATLKIKKQLSGDKALLGPAKLKSVSSLTEMKKGRQTVSEKLLDELQNKYRINSRYITHGEGEIFADGASLTGETNNKTDTNSKYVALLEKYVEIKDREISSLQEELREVSKRLNDVVQNQRVTYASILASQAEILRRMAQSDRKDETVYIASAHKKFLGSLPTFETEGILSGINKLNSL